MRFLGAPRREAEKRYRERETKAIGDIASTAHDHSNENINDKAKEAENSKIKPVGDDKAEVENNFGSYTKTISIINDADPKKDRVHPVENLPYDALWEPALINGKHAVKISESHPFYKKVYGPYLAQHLVVEGLDDLLWALAEAENSTCSDVAIENYQDMRFTVSRILKKLVADLPEPELPEN